MKPNRKVLKIILFCATIIGVTPSFGAPLKKVLILNLVNVDKNASYNYLQSSITDAIRKKLHSRFSFNETAEYKWKEIAEANYIFPEDYHTRSAAISLGLLAKQDIVIAGGYKISTKSGTRMLTHIRIFDLSKRKVIAEIKSRDKIDSGIFQSVDKIAAKIANAAKKVLSQKGDFTSTSISSSAAPIFSEPVVGLRIGGAFYALGFADRLEASQPSFHVNIRANMPIIWHKLTFAAGLSVVNHTWKKDFNTLTSLLDYRTTNYLAGLSLGFDFKISRKFGLLPKIGGGLVLQSTTISGEVNEEAQNSLPYIDAGLEFSYLLNPSIELVLDYRTAAELESSTLTLLNMVQFGINLAI